MKKAFTLIELLVVIAIIAILAAILFPVFAQAKAAAKKTAYISNFKQTGTAVQIYLTDYDDRMPQSMVKRPAPTSTWFFGGVHPTPANAVLSPPWDTPERIQQASCVWANALQPYMKNYNILEMPGGAADQVAGEIFNPAVTPANVGMTMNGYLHTYSSTSIDNVSVVPLFWNVQAVNFKGRSFSTPAMLCMGVDSTCYFNPTGSPDGDPSSSNGGYYIYDSTHTVWQYGMKRGVFVRADSSAKSLPQGTTIDPNYVSWDGKLKDPFAGVTKEGYPLTLWGCDSTFNGQGAGTAWCYFRPDRTE